MTLFNMKKLLIIITLIVSVAFSGCEKITDTVWMYYDETWGVDPWGKESVPEKEKINNIEKYLKNRKVKVFDVKIVADANVGSILCYAMHCKSGKRIHCKIKEKDLNKATSEGFYQ